MRKKNMIPIKDFCFNHNIEISFIQLLQQNGLIEYAAISESGYIDAEILLKLEKFIRLRFEFDINLEGIETISHLLNKINEMKDEITALKNRLQIHEAID